MDKKNQKGVTEILLVFAVIILLAIVFFVWYRGNGGGFGTSTQREDAMMENGTPTISDSTDTQTIEMELDATTIDNSELESELEQLDKDVIELQ